MFKNNLSELFPFAHTLYGISELILVGSDIPSWLDIVSGHGPEKVHYINQSEKNYNFDSLPPNWQVSSKLLAKEDGDITFYTLSNPMLNGTVSSDLLANLWQNLTTLETAQKEAVSLKSFMDKACGANSSKMIVVDSFDGLALVDELESSQVDVVALRVVADDEEAFTNVSELKVKQKLQEYGYKNIATYEDNHPKIKTVVYVKDMKRQTRECEENLNFVKQNAQKELTITVDAKEQELANLKSELETKNRALQEKQANSEQLQHQKTELENKTKTLEENLQQITSAKEALQKESATTNKIKEQEINNLKSDLENLNESNIKLASALEEQKKLHTEHLALNTQKTKELQENVNKERAAKEALQKELSEVKTQLEYKTKELAATNQTKEQELAKLKSELETKNRALQEKQANSEQLQHQKVELNTKVETLQNEKQSLEEKLKTIPELENKIKTLVDTTQKEISELKTANQTKEQELQKLKSELESKTKEFQESINKEKIAKETSQKELNAVKTQLETKRQELTNSQQSKEQELQKLKSELESKTKELNDMKVQLEGINNEIDRKDALLEVQSNIKEHINRTSKNIIKQTEAYIALKYYLDKPLNYHNWPISPDIALFMAQKIEQENYDLILEFGSGTSTVLFANISKQKKHADTKDVKIISLEHSEEYWNKTKKLLRAYKLEKFAKVKYCPLEEYTYLDQLFQYYDCQNIFKKLQKKNRYEKLLVLVDGPPASIGELSRFPAILYLLEFFPNKEIHIVLDDFSRKDEQDTLEKWEKIFDSKMIKYSKEIVNTEKGLCYLKINEKGL